MATALTFYIPNRLTDELICIVQIFANDIV